MAYPDGFHLKGFIINSSIIFFIPRLHDPAQLHAKLGTRQYEVFVLFCFFNLLALLKAERKNLFFVDVLARGTSKKPLRASRGLVILALFLIPAMGVIYPSPFHLLQITDLFPVEP